MDYSSYSSIKTELKAQLSLLSNWSTTLFYGVYDAITSMVAYALYKDVYHGLFLYKESGWLTAEKTSSLRGMAYLLGYTPHRRIGASGNIVSSGSSTFSNSYVWQGNNVFFPKWTRFCNDSKSVNVYCTDYTTYFNGNVGSCTIPVKEGVPKQYTYVANGDVDEKIYLYSDKIDNDEIEVLIVDSNGAILEQVFVVENLYFYNEPSTYYCTVTNGPEFDYIYLTFGDNVTTKKLESGAYVLIKYAETSGDTGNIGASNTITKILDTIYDSSGSEVTNVYVTNQDSISEGLAYEDIESIRNNAPNLFVAGYRCGTLNDWSSVVKSIPYINNAIVWSINSIGGSSLISEQNIIFISAINSEGENLSTAQKNNVVTLLEDNYSSPTEVIQFEDSEKIYIYFDISATIKNSTSHVMDSIIKDTLYEKYKTINSSFARKIYQSEYIKYISSLDNIVYCDIEAKMMDYNIGYAVVEYPFKGYYNATANSEKVNIYQGSPEIWIKRKIDYVWQTPQKIGIASGTSFIPAQGSTYTFENTYISYTENVYSFVINEILIDYTNNNKATYGINNPSDSDPLGYIICMVYQTQDGNGDQTNSIRLSKPYQISDIDPYFIFNTITES